MAIDQTSLWLILPQSNISTSTLSFYCGKHSDFIVGRFFFSLEISTTISDSLFEVIVAGLLPNS